MDHTEQYVVVALVAVFFGIVLFGSYQYKAHERPWGLWLILWAAAELMFVGLVLRYEFYVLGGYLAAAMPLVYWVGWRRVGGGDLRWRTHLSRAAVVAACLGPVMAVPLPEVADFGWCWWWVWCWPPYARHALAALYMLPGFLLVGAATFLLSVLVVSRRRRQRPSGPLRWGCAVATLVTLAGLNWYAAGLTPVEVALALPHPGTLRYVAWSRPGCAHHRDRRGVPLLMRMTSRNHAEHCRTLLAMGADVNAAFEGGWTPLHSAANSGSAATAVLIAAGAQVKARDENQNTALHVAARRNLCPAIRMLLRAGAELEARNRFAETPLYCAAAWGNIEATKTLLSFGATADPRDRFGKTPLLRASFEDRLGAALLATLVAGGADINARDDGGSTPLDHARNDVIEADLRARGAKTSYELRTANQ